MTDLKRLYAAIEGRTKGPWLDAIGDNSMPMVIQTHNSTAGC
jgi:hypothetical protein